MSCKLEHDEGVSIRTPTFFIYSHTRHPIATRALLPRPALAHVGDVDGSRRQAAQNGGVHLAFCLRHEEGLERLARRLQLNLLGEVLGVLGI